MLFANVIVDISLEKLDKTFQYRVPEKLIGQIEVGSPVTVPFGRRTVSGYVLELTDEAVLDLDKIKEIAALKEKSATLSARLIQLAAWMKKRYGCTMNQALKTVVPARRLVKKGKVRVSQMPGALPGPSDSRPAIVLNDEQRRVVSDICLEWEGKNRPTLLFGITGSGKTQVYMELIARVLASGRQAILLIPEIALTYQNLKRFHARFGDCIGVLNSRLSAGEKSESMEKARRGELSLMIGPRSALFTPFERLGLIIVDEEHESSYNSESVPRYRSVEVACKIGEMTGAHVVLGSATPSVDSFFRAQAGSYAMTSLTRRAGGGRVPQVYIEDLRQELREGNKSIFSRRLAEKIADRLERGEQTILFLNRRGYAGFVSCRSCGLCMKCPHCAVSLTMHRDGKLRCHYCGYTISMPQQCPACGSPYIASFGTGTQKIESLVEKAFPQARVLRMDADTTAGKDGHSRLLHTFAEGDADILIGTQMIVKGHDFPNVTLVGILAADLSLHAGDYRCSETTFQLITQAAGRAGRSDKPGEVVIQTYSPEHYAIACAAAQDYPAFYREEILFRRLLKYPPSGHLLSIVISGEEQERLWHRAELLKRGLCELAAKMPNEQELSVIGPAPAGSGKLQGVYRSALYIKHSSQACLLALRDFAEKNFTDELQCDIL